MTNSIYWISTETRAPKDSGGYFVTLIDKSEYPHSIFRAIAYFDRTTHTWYEMDPFDRTSLHPFPKLDLDRVTKFTVTHWLKGSNIVPVH